MICFHSQNTSKHLFACKDKCEDVVLWSPSAREEHILEGRREICLKNIVTHRSTCLLAKTSVKNKGVSEINMNERELMKLAETWDEFSVSDYTVEELERMSNKSPNFKEKYFDYYDDVKDRTRKKQDW